MNNPDATVSSDEELARLFRTILFRSPDQRSECVIPLFPQPPAGWMALWERARHAKDTPELTRIIDEMNKLLDDYDGGQWK
jgi:hypothetical protein